MKENVQKQWRRHLCCGRFRLADNSGKGTGLSGFGEADETMSILPYTVRAAKPTPLPKRAAIQGMCGC